MAAHRIRLCDTEGGCPEVLIDVDREEVYIGEQGNLVILNKDEWNDLVDKIKTGELTEI